MWLRLYLHILSFVNFSICGLYHFLAPYLNIHIHSGCLVSSTPNTVLYQSNSKLNKGFHRSKKMYMPFGLYTYISLSFFETCDLCHTFTLKCYIHVHSGCLVKAVTLSYSFIIFLAQCGLLWPCFVNNCFKNLSFYNTVWRFTQLGRNDPYMALFNMCSNVSVLSHIYVTTQQAHIVDST